MKFKPHSNYAKRVITIALLASSPTSQASVLFNVAFDDPLNTFSAYYQRIETDVKAAGSLWGQYFVGNRNIDIAISFSDSIPTANGGSVTSSYLFNNGLYDVWQSGAASEISTGIDPNGTAPDIQITLGSTYLSNELWFDSNPGNASIIPVDKTDAVSVFTHELGHAFGFSGWRDWTTGALPGNYESSFDQYVVEMGSNFFFTGPNAVAVYGAYIPLTYGNLFHLGNAAPLPGADLIPDLMNGIVYERGVRYEISALDLAILKDTGVAMVPVPAAFWLFGSVLLGFISLAGSRKTTTVC